jgi:hypothetical protein
VGLVAVLLALNTAQVGAECALIYAQGILPLSVADRMPAVALPSAFKTATGCSNVSIMLSQLFFAHRVRVLGNALLLPAAIAFTSFAAATYATVILALIAGLPSLDGRGQTGLLALNSWYEPFWWVSLGVDITLAASLTYFLRKRDQHISAVCVHGACGAGSDLTMGHRTTSMLQSVATMTISNTALTVFLQLCTVIWIRVGANSTYNNVCIAFEAVIAPVFLACLLWTLVRPPSSSARYHTDHASPQMSRERIRDKAIARSGHPTSSVRHRPLSVLPRSTLCAQSARSPRSPNSVAPWEVQLPSPRSARMSEKEASHDCDLELRVI